jgi:hypothetical protein
MSRKLQKSFKEKQISELQINQIKQVSDFSVELMALLEKVILFF